MNVYVTKLGAMAYEQGKEVFASTERLDISEIEIDVPEKDLWHYDRLLYKVRRDSHE